MNKIKNNLIYFKNNVIFDKNNGNNLFLINGFTTIIKNLEKHLSFNLIEFFPQGHRLDIITNFIFFLVKKYIGGLKKYKVIHINTWENFLNASKIKGQVLIGESHGFHFGLNFQDTLKHFHGIKKVVASLVEILLGSLIRYKIKKFDLYYVSTPNMLEYAKKIRIDAKWLPNAINIDIFNPNGEKEELVGNPVIFYPTRLHSFKNPKFGIDLFFKIKEKYPKATLHLIKYPSGGDPLASYYGKILTDKNTYFWHSFKTSEELAKMYRGSDIVMGHFHGTLGMMSLVELEATACGTAVISYDKYEVKTYLKDLENITFSILEDKNKYNDFVNINKKIVINNHSAEYIAKKLESDIKFIDEGYKIIGFNEKVIKNNLHEIEFIEKENFSNIGLRGENEFLYKLKNKFDCSYILLKNNVLAGYIIGYSDYNYGYINRFAISKKYSGKGLGNRLLEHFTDNLKYNMGVNVIELVTHSILNVDGYYQKNGYLVANYEHIVDFLNRKSKIEEIDNYIGKNKSMVLYYKNI